MSAERSMTLADSIMADTTFVLRGVMSKKWNGVIKFAVSDPIKNKSHELRAAGNGRFEMTVPDARHDSEYVSLCRRCGDGACVCG